MTGSGAILGLITTDSTVTGPLTTKPVAREVIGTVTTETATRGTTIDTSRQSSEMRWVCISGQHSETSWVTRGR
jgi:hypothetical protein